MAGAEQQGSYQIIGFFPPLYGPSSQTLGVSQGLSWGGVQETNGGEPGTSTELPHELNNNF